MLVAPFTLSMPSAARRPRAPAPIGRHPIATPSGTPRMAWAPFVLGIWLAIGLAGLIVMPAARGSASLGATLPFWLVVAPLLDLAWLKRADIAAVLRRQSRSARMRRAAARAATPLRHWRR